MEAGGQGVWSPSLAALAPVARFRELPSSATFQAEQTQLQQEQGSIEGWKSRKLWVSMGWH